MLKFCIYFILFSAIEGYVKMKFVAATNRYDNATYGCGSIIDGVRKLNINVTNYSPIPFEKGTAVIITGHVNDKSNFFYIYYTSTHPNFVMVVFIILLIIFNDKNYFVFSWFYFSYMRR